MFVPSSNQAYLAAAMLLVLPSTFAELTAQCITDLSEMYDMSSLTYNTIQEPQKIASMITKLDIPFSANYHVYNGNTVALEAFVDTCSAFVSTSGIPVGGRVTFLSSTNKCTHNYNIGIPACIPATCDSDDGEITKYLTDNPTPVFAGNDCADVFWANEEIMEYEALPNEISTQCMSEVLTISGSAMAGASNITAVGEKAVEGSCKSYYDGKEYGTSIIEGTYMVINYEMVCDEEIKKVMDGLFCMPSSCDSKRTIAIALNVITYAEEVNPYFVYLYFSSDWKASCKWVYNIPTEKEIVTDQTLNDSMEDKSTSASRIDRCEMLWISTVLVLIVSSIVMVY